MRFNAKKKIIDGITFDSGREAARYEELKLLQLAGEIRNLKCHTRYPLKIGEVPIKIRSDRCPNGRPVMYTDDFSYEEKVMWYPNGEERFMAWGEVVEDVKGYDAPIARLRRAVWEACYGQQIRIVK